METIEIDDKTTVADIVTHNIRTATVFRKYGIDFCCGGQKPVKDVCAAKNINVTALTSDLEKLEPGGTAVSADADKWELDFLANYIVNIHHTYVREHLPTLKAWSEKVSKVHGDHNPETVRVAQLVKAIDDELIGHMFKEENVLFPFIGQIVSAKKNGTSPSFTRIENPIAVMLHEHESVGNMFKEIEELTGNFTPPAHACNTFRALYSLLREFEDDLFLHIHLENNILFPKALAMRDELIA